MRVAHGHINFLCRYERASNNIEYVDDGSEDKSFWKLWGFADGEPNPKTIKNPEWDPWFINHDDKVSTRAIFSY
jgi:hypothetical protein